MLKTSSMPLKHMDLFTKLKANSMPQNIRFQNAFSALEKEFEKLSSIEGLEGSQNNQVRSLPLLWTPLDSQMILMRQLALSGRFNIFAENLRAMRWDISGGSASLVLRLKAFYLDLSITLDPFHSCQADLVALLEEIQISEDDYFKYGDSYSDMDAFKPSPSSLFSSLSNKDQESKVLSQAIEYGLWDAVLFVLGR